MRCPVHRRFFLIRRSSIDGSPVRSSISLFVTLSIQVILMIDRRCRIMKACSFFTCRLYTVQVSAPYRRVDSTIALYILPLTRMGMQVLQYRYCNNSGSFDAPAMQSCKPLPCGTGSCQNRRLREQTLTRKPCHCGSIKGG